MSKYTTEGQRIKQRTYNRRLRTKALEKLGNKCSSPNCRWLNEDGTFGCIDKDLLQVDHVNGDGYKDRQHRRNQDPGVLCRLVLRDFEGRFQLLCANCNWKKRIKNKEDN